MSTVCILIFYNMGLVKFCVYIFVVCFQLSIVNLMFLSYKYNNIPPICKIDEYGTKYIVIHTKTSISPATPGLLISALGLILFFPLI